MIVLAALMLIVSCKKEDIFPNPCPPADDSEQVIDSTLLTSKISGEWVLFETDNSGNGWESVESDSIYVDITDSLIIGLPEPGDSSAYVVVEDNTIFTDWGVSGQKYIYITFEGNKMLMNGEGGVNLKLRPR